MVIVPFAMDAEPCACINHAMFEFANQRHDFAKALEVTNRIHNQLSGAVKGHVPATLDLDEIYAAFVQRGAAHQNILRLGIAPHRDDGRMLYKDPRFRIVAALHALMELTLQLPDFAVRAQAQIENPRGHRLYDFAAAATGCGDFGLGLTM